VGIRVDEKGSYVFPYFHQFRAMYGATIGNAQRDAGAIEARTERTKLVGMATGGAD
jgi:hypothetical protein